MRSALLPERNNRAVLSFVLLIQPIAQRAIHQAENCPENNRGEDTQNHSLNEFVAVPHMLLHSQF
jgi:hypothetical protein